MATATFSEQRAWVPEWKASGPMPGTDEVYLVASELLARTPAARRLEAIIGALGADRLGEAIDDLRDAAYDVGRAVPGIVAEVGQPIDHESYLSKLAERAGVKLVAGRAEQDGLFYVTEPER
jgi:hypothetical protein